MKLERFKETNHKRIGIIVFTLICLFLVSGAILYRTFAIFEVKTNQNVINGQVQSMGDIEFAFYKDDILTKNVPTEDGYAFDSSKSYCIDRKTGNQVSNVSWNSKTESIELNHISELGKTKCYIYFNTIYQEKELNGAIPDLMNGRLVPVKILDTNKPSDIDYVGAVGGKVVKANITEKDNPWYDYSKKQWANAVILKDGVVDDYKIGEEIPESDIESYFVWIPRYRYKLKKNEEELNIYNSITQVVNVGSVSEFYSTHTNDAVSNAFEIEFETKDSGVKRGTTKGSWLTHPAFTAFDSNGFWVGKFETGYNQNSTNEDVTPNNNWNADGALHNEEKAEKVIIKPHVYSWRYINVSNAFYTSYQYKRELDSHMMKNTEWGAVAYLTQSKYGRCMETDGNTICDEVNRNNSSSYITGMSTTEPATCGFTGTSDNCNYSGGPSSLREQSVENIKNYYLTDSQGGSTTGNYSGIYDMSGGSHEYVMGVMQAKAESPIPSSGRNSASNSGFKGPYSCPGCENQTEQENTNGKEWPSQKYYDLYDFASTDQDFKRGHLGDGTKEFGPFYQVSYNSGVTARYIGSYNGDDAFFVSPGFPWFLRGGIVTYGTGAGVSTFDAMDGGAVIAYSFRIVLTP